PVQGAPVRCRRLGRELWWVDSVSGPGAALRRARRGRGAPHGQPRAQRADAGARDRRSHDVPDGRVRRDGAPRHATGRECPRRSLPPSGHHAGPPGDPPSREEPRRLRVLLDAPRDEMEGPPPRRTNHRTARGAGERRGGPMKRVAPGSAAGEPERQYGDVPWVTLLRPGEFASFLELRTAVAAESSHLETEPGELEETACVSHSLLEALGANPSSAVFVARRTEGLAGWVALYGGQLRRTRHTAELEIGVRRAYRRRGLGHALLKAALRHVAASDGLVKVTLRVMGTNAPAL